MVWRLRFSSPGSACIDELSGECRGDRPSATTGREYALRIWIINPAAAPPREGTGTRHFDFARRLIARGHQVIVVASAIGHLGQRYKAVPESSSPILEPVNGVPFLWLPGMTYAGNGVLRLLGMLSSFWTIWQGRGLTGMDRPDVIVGSSPHPFAAFAAMLLARRLRVPFVLEIRDVWPASITTTGRLNERHPLIVLLAWMERRLYRGASQIITLLPGTPNHIERTGGDPARITVVPNGADMERFGPVTPQPEFDGLRIVYIGTVGLWYGLDTAIDAMAILKTRGMAADQVTLTFIGGGTEEPRLKADCAERDLDNIQFLGRIPKAEVPTRLAAYDACLAVVKNAPLYNEGGVSLNKLFDYMAAARPILFSSSAYNDPVSEAGAGFTSPGGDAVALADNIALLASMTTAQRSSMGLAGREHVATAYNFDVLAVTLEGVLERATRG